MTRRLPLWPTALVALAVTTMIALGVWQLQRMQWKEALLARYAQAEAMSSEVAWPRTPAEAEQRLFRHATVTCAHVTAIDARAGRSAKGESGWAHDARCRTADGAEVTVALGWSIDPASPRWSGGTVGGTIGPAGHGAKLVASPPQAGLAQLAAPDPRDVPNNHMAYAIQWFLFALTALVIYALALRKRLRSADQP